MARNLLAAAAKIVQRKLKTHGAIEGVIYHRPGGPTFQIDAIAGQIVTETEDLAGVVVRTVTRDFTVDQVDLIEKLGENGRPLKNDELSYQINGFTHKYIANADGFTVSHYDESDAYGVAFRIHTRRDSITPP